MLERGLGLVLERELVLVPVRGQVREPEPVLALVLVLERVQGLVSHRQR